ncbi:glycosyltransferase [Candidatus Latescibacterota bacterium]
MQDEGNGAQQPLWKANLDVNIWLVQTSEPVPVNDSIRKMRTALLADKLVEGGHSVVWWTSAFDHFRKEWLSNDDAEAEPVSGLRIVAVKGIGYSKNVSMRRFVDYRIVARKFRKMASGMPRPDVIVASMPHDILYEAVMFAKRQEIPAIADIRDRWPDTLLDPFPGRLLRSVARMVLSRDFAMVGEALRAADGLVAATDSFLRWGMGHAGRDKTWKDRVFFHGYKKLEKSEEGSIGAQLRRRLEPLRGKFVVLFIGTISDSYHNPLLLLRAAERLTEDENTHFVIAGDGELLPRLEEEAQGVANVTLTGWLNKDEIEYAMDKASVGVCPATRETDVPTNKFFSYLSAGLPVVSAFQGDTRDITESRHAGLYYPPNDVDAFVEHVRTLRGNQTLCKEMSENARRVFSDMFDADKIYEEYAGHVVKVAERARRQ